MLSLLKSEDLEQEITQTSRRFLMRCQSANPAFLEKSQSQKETTNNKVENLLHQRTKLILNIDQLIHIEKEEQRAQQKQARQKKMTEERHRKEINLLNLKIKLR
ncbi:uncharacterized protein LOC126884917 [Diabrotica virgifera virgifera]|uniref:Uncharacterized protein n=1 Tax=Diabrotica virgifera virgifera TaxID=50390 RepID=A0ABM5KAK3_DIAVI|nr:uncharacterized protein LOC126884917 [Diabrotica virgifera virgifera]